MLARFYKFVFSFGETIGKKVLNYYIIIIFYGIWLKFGEKGKTFPVRYTMTKGYTPFRMLPDLTTKVNSFDDFNKSRHYFIILIYLT